MYGILKNVIGSGSFKLTEIQHKAKKLYAMGELSDEQLDELMAMSQTGASPEAERPETLQMLREIADRVTVLEKKLADQDSTEPEEAEYETWHTWDGISDKYQKGAIVSHKDKLWVSVSDGQNVWEPGTPGTENLWVEYDEEETENV